MSFVISLVRSISSLPWEEQNGDGNEPRLCGRRPGNGKYVPRHDLTRSYAKNDEIKNMKFRVPAMPTRNFILCAVDKTGTFRARAESKLETLSFVRQSAGNCTCLQGTPTEETIFQVGIIPAKEQQIQ
jgi:hypothetical protein